MGEAAAVDAGARTGGTGHRGEGEHQGVGEGHRAHREDDRQILRRQGEYDPSELAHGKYF